MPDLLLCADVGGTNTRLRLVDADHPSSPLVEKNYGDGEPVVEAVGLFAQSLGDRAHSISAAAFGIAGRVVEGDVRMTNRPDEVITDETLSAVLSLPKSKICVVNDMVAHLSGVDVSETITLREGKCEGDVEGIVMPGTGLGVGFAVWHGGRRMAMPGEGGHLDFGPPTAEHDLLLPCGRSQVAAEASPGQPLHHRVSWEWFLSGPGLARIYACYAGELKHKPGAWRQISPRDVTAAALGEKKTDLDTDTATRTTRAFIELAGARAGNLCVELLASRGIYLGGNILNLLYDDQPERFVATFLGEFDAVGPDALRETLENTPIHLLRSPDSGLRGAAVLAREAI